MAFDAISIVAADAVDKNAADMTRREIQRQVKDLNEDEEGVDDNDDDHRRRRRPHHHR